MNEKWLQEIEALCERATPGPWRLEEDFEGCPLSIAGPEDVDVLRPGQISWMKYLDADHSDLFLMVRARTAMPELIAEVRRLQRQNAAMTDELEFYHAEFGKA